MAYPWDVDTKPHAPKHILDYTYEELKQQVCSWGFKEYNAQNLFAGIHRYGFTSAEQFDRNKVSPKLLANLNKPLEIFKQVTAYPSQDGSTKYMYQLEDGSQIESVFMPFGRYATLCVSSQVGCALGCTFCATGAMGFKRHLSAGEIVGQVLHMGRHHGLFQGQTNRFNVVFMGMGEPLHNLHGLMRSFEIMTHRHGLVLSPKDIAVSTSGLVPKIKELAAMERRPRLMVSIAATEDEQRSGIMPVNRAYSLETLLACLEAFPLQKRERIMLSYVLIDGINNRPKDMENLIAMSRRFPSLINLIPLNEHEASPGMKEPADEALHLFAKGLRDAGIFTTIRYSRGRDVAGACGQLANRKDEPITAENT